MPGVGVIIDWPYHMLPMVYYMSLWQSDIRMEKYVMLVRTASPHSDAGFNASVQYCLDQGADEIITVSCDQSVPHDILSRWRTLSKQHNADVIGALYATRQPGHDWLIWDIDKDGKTYRCAPEHPFQKVHAIGGGCLYFKASAFRKIPRPWFETKIGPDGFTIESTNEYNFFMKARAAGVNVYVDNERVSDHQYEVMLNAQSLGRSTPRLEIVTTTDEQRAIAEKRERNENVLAGAGYKPW